MNPQSPPLTDNKPSLHRLGSVPTLGCGETPFGPLHSIAADDAGNLYCTDELNHRLISLNEKGRVRWIWSGPGKAQNQLHYPRGLSLGTLVRGKNPVSCLAVCDSWNRRLQVFNLEGDLMDTWTEYGGMPFGEVSDVRFVCGESNPGISSELIGFWLVLDRGNHRACAFHPDGSMLFQVGRLFPPEFENRWAIPSLFFQENAKSIPPLEEYPHCDYLFYPERILGNTKEALFLWTSKGALKQLLPPNLFPIRLEPDRSITWIAADQSGLLGWQDSANLLVRYGNSCERRAQINLKGKPVHSNAPLDEFWTQEQGELVHWRWNWGIEGLNASEEARAARFFRNASEEYALLDAEAVQTAFEECMDGVNQSLWLAGKLLDMGKNKIDPLQLNEIKAHISLFEGWRPIRLRKLHQAIHPWCLGSLKRALFEPNSVAPAVPAQARSVICNSCSQQAYSFSARIQCCLKELCNTQTNATATKTENPSTVEAWTGAVSAAASNLTCFLEWIQAWFGETIPDPAKNSDHTVSP